jgi:hypothetical protein
MNRGQESPRSLFMELLTGLLHGKTPNANLLYVLCSWRYAKDTPLFSKSQAVR